MPSQRNVVIAVLCCATLDLLLAATCPTAWTRSTGTLTSSSGPKHTEESLDESKIQCFITSRWQNMNKMAMHVLLYLFGGAA